MSKKVIMETMACPFCDADECEIRLTKTGRASTIFCSTCMSRCFLSPAGLTEARALGKVAER